MKNFESLLAAYLISWAVFFAYLIVVAARLRRMREELERLKEMLRRS